MADQLQGVTSMVRLDSTPEERCVTLWLKTASQKFSTSELRTLARHMLEYAEDTDTEANRKDRFLPEPEPAPSFATPEIPEATLDELQDTLNLLRKKLT
jgi:hypothetical protein